MKKLRNNNNVKLNFYWILGYLYLIQIHHQYLKKCQVEYSLDLSFIKDYDLLISLLCLFTIVR